MLQNRYSPGAWLLPCRYRKRRTADLNPRHLSLVMEFVGFESHPKTLPQYLQIDVTAGIFLGGKGRPARKADNLTAICGTIV
jgi:hypothetical protein